jgi:hypothetical protein
MVRGLSRKAQLYLNEPKNGKDIIAVIALLDLYGPTFYPDDKQMTPERYEWAKRHLEKQVGHPKFHQHFAVHELEAWLLSDPAIFPAEIKKSLVGKYVAPEKVNSLEPPAKLLENLYRMNLKRAYRKPIDGKALFHKLSPAAAYDKCPYLKALLDEMLTLAQQAGLS